mgnify:CR=1 FL=1|jgi:hypothetical protein
MNYLFIILPAIAIVTVVTMYIFTKSAHEIKEELPVIKFEPRKVTDLSKGEIGTDPVKEEPVSPPKKKKNYYKKRTKKAE